MREKIKELVKQATSYTWNGDGVTEELDTERFADLIIDECIIAIEEVKKFPVTTYERDMTDSQTVDKCVQAVKDKFK